MNLLPDLTKKKHIIWDYNGTILNDMWLCVSVINEMLFERNIPGITVSSYQEMFDFPVKDYYSRIGFDFKSEPFEKVGKEFIDRYDLRKRECDLQDGVVKMIRWFHKLGMQQSILSARELTALKEELSVFGLDSYFGRIAGLDSFHAHGKTEIGIELLGNIGLDSSEVLMIGDTLHDCHVAREMGVDVVLLSIGHHTAKRLKECTSYVIDSFHQLRESFEWNKPITDL
jgi:phosphoglycolate phosphatase